MKYPLYLAISVLALALLSCGTDSTSTSDKFIIYSDAFNSGDTLPQKHADLACGGNNIQPPLGWVGEPSGTKSYAIIMDDLYADSFTHLVLYDIPASDTGLDEGYQASGDVKSGVNDYGNTGYNGPCPPLGDNPHQYRISIFALNTTSLGLPGSSPKSVVQNAMEGKIVKSAETYCLFGVSQGF